MSRPTRHDVLLNVAEALAERSTCHRAQVGAIIARDFRIISTGYNGSPSGMPHCPLDEEPGCDRTVHAEANAIVYAARQGIATEGATLYTTLSPCVECAKLIVNAGIQQVYYAEAYRIPDGIQYLMDAGVNVSWLNR